VKTEVGSRTLEQMSHVVNLFICPSGRVED